MYLLCPIGQALVGAITWAELEVVVNLCGLLSSDKQLQEETIWQWIEDYNSDWEVLWAQLRD